MIELYKEFFNACEAFDKLVQEEKWKHVKSKAELKNIIHSEFEFWTRVLKMLPPERRLLKEYAWMKQCYEQVLKNLEEEPVNWKIRWLCDEKDKL